MNLLDQVKMWLGLKPAPNPEASALRQLLESGRRAKHAEDYPAALDAFDRALQFASANAISIHDRMALNIIKLHQADIYISQKRWEDAEKLLSEIKLTAQSATAHYAYTLDVLGTLASSQKDVAAARTYHEQALKE